MSVLVNKSDTRQCQIIIELKRKTSIIRSRKEPRVRCTLGIGDSVAPS
jgi:hypothetical protein